MIISSTFSSVVNTPGDGLLRVVGSVKNTPDTPVKRRVRLYRQASGALVREVWSDATTGAYSFDNIRAGTFYITAFDYTGEYNGVIATDVASEPM